MPQGKEKKTLVTTCYNLCRGWGFNFHRGHPDRALRNMLRPFPLLHCCRTTLFTIFQLGYCNLACVQSSAAWMFTHTSICDHTTTSPILGFFFGGGGHFCFLLAVHAQYLPIFSVLLYLAVVTSKKLILSFSEANVHCFGWNHPTTKRFNCCVSGGDQLSLPV